MSRELEEKALADMIDPEKIKERIDRKKSKAAEFLEENMFSQAISELVQVEQLSERLHVIKRIKAEELDFSNQSSLPEAM